MKAIINQLIQDKQLSKEQARQVIINIADGHYNTSQIAAFLTVFIVVILIFLYTNPILGVVFIFVAYELLRRSAAVYKAQPMMKNSPTERKKTQEMVRMNPPKETTLEEQVIQKMAPAQKKFIRDDSGSNFKPVYDLINGASKA